MIILSFLVFAAMLVWALGSVIAVAIGVSCLDNPDGHAGPLCTLLVGIFSLVCWYQVLVWGEPWFRVLAQAWM